MNMRNVLLVVSGPSGVGKGTLVKELITRRQDVVESVSCTTRAPREGEIHGKHYFFLSKEEFTKRIAEGDFLEYVTVGESGPDHDKVFEVEARMNSNIIGRGTGKSKREAEQNAALEALKLFGEL